MAIKAKFCKFQLGYWVNAIFKKVGLYLHNHDSYLIHNSPYAIKLASKLKLRYITFIQWDGLICRLTINTDVNFRN